MLNSVFYLKHRDDEFFDRAEVVVVPRYKTSGLSGDEWRVSATLRLYRKGVVVHERSFGDFETACTFLPSEIIRARENGLPDGFDHKLDELKCFQPSCPAPGTTEVRLKQRFSAQGERLDPSELQLFEHRRRFCPEHAERGDCGREDSDANYEVVAPSVQPASPFPKPRTKDRLAEVLRAEGLPEMERAARAGHYDDYESDIATPIIQLVADLRSAGREDLAKRAMEGEWDGTKQEGEAWFNREGKDLLRSPLRPGQ